MLFGNLDTSPAIPVLAREVDFRMHHPHMPGKTVVSSEFLLLNTKRTTDLLLISIMDGVFMSREIIWPPEDCIATLASGWIDALAFVLAILTTADNWRAFLLGAGSFMGKHMVFQLLSRLKTEFAAMMCACVATCIYGSRSLSWLWHVRVAHGALIFWSTTLLDRCVDIRTRGEKSWTSRNLSAGYGEG